MEQISDDILQGQKDRLMSDKKLQDMIAQRQLLPVAAMKNNIMAAINDNSVIIIRGNTGCGKTTQVKINTLQVKLENTCFFTGYTRAFNL